VHAPSSTSGFFPSFLGLDAPEECLWTCFSSCRLPHSPPLSFPDKPCREGDSRLAEERHTVSNLVFSFLPRRGGKPRSLPFFAAVGEILSPTSPWTQPSFGVEDSLEKLTCPSVRVGFPPRKLPSSLPPRQREKIFFLTETWAVPFG